MKTHALLIVAGCATLVALSGCVTAGTQAKVKAMQEATKAIDRNSVADLAAATGIVTKSTAPIEAAAAQLNQEIVFRDDRFDQLNQELERQKLEFKTFVIGALAIVGETATELVPGGTAAARALAVLKKGVDANQQAAAKAQSEGEAAKQAATSATTEATKQLTALKTELAAKEELRKKELELAQQELRALTSEQQGQLRTELLAVAREHGVAGAEGMSTEELLAALGAGGLGLAGLLRTFGRSRNATEVNGIATVQEKHGEKLAEASREVDELWTELKALQTKVEVADQRVVGSDLRQSVTLGDHERRLDLLEQAT